MLQRFSPNIFPKEKYPAGVDMTTGFFLLIVHAVAIIGTPLLVILSFMGYGAWNGYVLFGVSFFLFWFLYFVTTLGVTVGSHRGFTHKGFKMKPWVKFCLLLAATLSAQGSALWWIIVHKMHHHFSDKPGDPHSPNDGTWWSHILWMLRRFTSQEKADMFRRYGSSLQYDPMMKHFHKWFMAWNIGFGLLLFTVGLATGSWFEGCVFVVIGMFLRMVFVYHITWMINSFTHKYGEQRYADTDDNSRNIGCKFSFRALFSPSFWFSILSCGESYHNNHHKHESWTSHADGQGIDLSYAVICFMERRGWISDVKHPKYTDQSAAA